MACHNAGKGRGHRGCLRKIGPWVFPSTGNAAVVADGKIRSFQVDTLLEELEDRASVIRFTNSAKATFAGALDMDLVADRKKAVRTLRPVPE